jgi:hypothetical protein
MQQANPNYKRAPAARPVSNTPAVQEFTNVGPSAVKVSSDRVFASYRRLIEENWRWYVGQSKYSQRNKHRLLNAFNDNVQSFGQFVANIQETGVFNETQSHAALFKAMGDKHMTYILYDIMSGGPPPDDFHMSGTQVSYKHTYAHHNVGIDKVVKLINRSQNLPVFSIILFPVWFAVNLPMRFMDVYYALKARYATKQLGKLRLMHFARDNNVDFTNPVMKELLSKGYKEDSYLNNQYTKNKHVLLGGGPTDYEDLNVDPDVIALEEKVLALNLENLDNRDGLGADFIPSNNSPNYGWGPEDVAGIIDSRAREGGSKKPAAKKPAAKKPAAKKPAAKKPAAKKPAAKKPAAKKPAAKKA